MKPDDAQVNWVEEPKLGLTGKMYLPAIIQGLAVTTKHLFGPKMTVSFPEQRPEIGNPLIYRGVHRLNKDDQGRVKCVACFLCATACPAHCIDIVAAPSPWPDRDKYCESFTIDELRCIFCGMCEEACPTTAIQLTPDFEMAEYNRQNLVYEKEHLLISGPGKYPDYNFYRVSGMAIAGKPKGSAQNESQPVDIKSLLP